MISSDTHMAKLLYTMGEVAEMLGEAPSAVRYWSNYFDKFIKPARNAKGNRLFHPEDIDTLKQVQFLVKKQGLTLEGVTARFTEDRRSVESRVKALESLKSIRAQLVEVRKAL
jgi:DNA-binding transcriptional MerR regulator